MKLADKVVAITGAASGIGRALAHAFAGRGARVALCDVDADGLGATAEGLPSGRVTTHVVDVRDRAQMERWASDVAAAHGGADVIVNNAGVVARGTLAEVAWDDFAFVLDVNFWGVVHGVRAFLPLLRRRPEGHIVNISSINAMVPFAANGPYNASKYAVLGLSETLMQELRGEPIGVTCVHPGGIRTNIVRNARGADAENARLFDRVARTRPEEAACAIVRAVERKQARLYIGADAKVMAALKRALPALTVELAGRITRRVW